MTKMIKRIIIEIIRDELAAKFNMRLSNLGKVKKDALLAAAKKYDIKLEKLYPIYIQNEKDEEEKERLEQEEREKKWKEEKEEKERKKEEFNNKSKEWKEKIKKLVCIDFDIKYMEQLKDWESEEQKNGGKISLRWLKILRLQILISLGPMEKQLKSMVLN